MSAALAIKPTFTRAIELAQKHMRDAGRSQPNRADKIEMARLLSFVAVWEGGFLHGDDEQRAALAERIGLDPEEADRACMFPGRWPVEQSNSSSHAAE